MTSSRVEGRKRGSLLELAMRDNGVVCHYERMLFIIIGDLGVKGVDGSSVSTTAPPFILKVRSESRSYE